MGNPSHTRRGGRAESVAWGVNMDSNLGRTAILYRYFDANGGLLYIGMTERWTDRAAQHESKPWVKLAASVTMEQFPDRATLAEAERAAITSEKPTFNVMHNNGYRSGRRASARKIRLGNIVVSTRDQSINGQETCESFAWQLQNSVRLMHVYSNETPFRFRKYRSSQLLGMACAKKISAITGLPFQEICRAVGLDVVFRRTHADVLNALYGDSTLAR